MPPKEVRHWFRRHRRHRPTGESGWAALLVLGGSVVAAVLLIQMGVAMAAGAEPLEPHATRQAAHTAQATAVELRALAEVAQAR